MELSDIRFQNEMLQAELKMAKLEKDKAELQIQIMKMKAAKELETEKLKAKTQLTELQTKMEKMIADGKQKTGGKGEGSSSKKLDIGGEKETTTVVNNNLLVADENHGQHETATKERTTGNGSENCGNRA